MEPTIQVSTVFWMFMIWDGLILCALGVFIYYMREILNCNKKSLKCLEKLAKTKRRIGY
jgi:hypothetical protein